MDYIHTSPFVFIRESNVPISVLKSQSLAEVRGFVEKNVTLSPREPLILEPSSQAKTAMTCLKLSTLRVSCVTRKTVFVVVIIQLLSHVWLFVTPWSAACQALLSPTISWSLPKLMSIALVMPPNYLILCRPLLLLPSVFPSIRVFSNESALSWHQVAKVLELQL